MNARIFLSEPANPAVEAFLKEQRACELTYADIGCTRSDPPRGFDCDHNRVQLGSGEAAFNAARQAISTWRMFPATWMRVTHQEPVIGTDQTVAVAARVFGLWWLNSARVVYTIDNEERRFGFAYGTLPGHVECGEERFLVEWDENDIVWYDLRAMSRPQHWVTRLGYPVVRRMQRRFVLDSQRALIEAVAAGVGETSRSCSA